MITGSSEISYACDVREILDCSPELGNPSCLQTTSASLKSQKSSHTLPQELLKHTSTRPSSSVRPPTSLTSVLLQTRSEKHKPVHYQYVSSHDSLIHSICAGWGLGTRPMKILLGPVQFISSVPPMQSSIPSHTKDSGMQLVPEFILPRGQELSPSSQPVSRTNVLAFSSW